MNYRAVLPSRRNSVFGGVAREIVNMDIRNRIYSFGRFVRMAGISALTMWLLGMTEGVAVAQPLAELVRAADSAAASYRRAETVIEFVERTRPGALAREEHRGHAGITIAVHLALVFTAALALYFMFSSRASLRRKTAHNEKNRAPAPRVSESASIAPERAAVPWGKVLSLRSRREAIAADIDRLLDRL